MRWHEGVSGQTGEEAAERPRGKHIKGGKPCFQTLAVNSRVLVKDALSVLPPLRRRTRQKAASEFSISPRNASVCFI